MSKKTFIFIICSIVLLLLLIGCSKKPVSGAPEPPSLDGPPVVERNVDISKIKLSSEGEIQAKLLTSRPSLGGKIPEDIADRLGASHVAGKYHLTDEPFMIEGAKALLNMGSKVIKLWFTLEHNYGPASYPFNSTWPPKTSSTRLVDLAKMPYYKQVFEMDFSTIILLAHSGLGMQWKTGIEGNEEFFRKEEEEFYELAKYLLETYHDKEITFILQNWEGDWLLRGAGVMWTSGMWHEDIEEMLVGMIEWFRARQRGVTRAREEVPTSKAIVAHAIEVNRVLDVLDRIPTLISHVVPYVETDLVSYSSYDSALHRDSPASFWRAIEIIRHFTRPSELFGENNIYIGEIGNPESGRREEEMVAWWDKVFGVMFAMDIPYILHWELYCNEPLDGRAVQPGTVLSTDELRGFWLIRPDGSYSYAGQYIYDLLNHGK